MKLVVQRVSEASVKVDGAVCGKINRGLLVLLGIHKDDQSTVIPKFVKKLINLRIFPDKEEKLNLSVKDIGGEVLVVSQFTLYGDCSKGNRPGFTEAAKGEEAKSLYIQFVQEVKEKLGKVETGEFGASMAVSLTNDGPVTLIF